MTDEWIYDKNKTVCFSGHRQEKLPDNGDPWSLKMKTILSMLYFAVHQSIEEGYDTFIVGGARGIDLIAAECVYQFIHQGKNIRLVVALPYPGFGSGYKGSDLYMRGNAIAEADQVITVCDKCSRNSYSKRNQFMVDHSSRLIAVVSDMQSGTGQTIRYAEKAGLDLKLIYADRIAEIVDNACEDDVEIIEETTQIKNVVRIYLGEDKKKPY